MQEENLWNEHKISHNSRFWNLFKAATQIKTINSYPNVPG